MVQIEPAGIIEMVRSDLHPLLRGHVVYALLNVWKRSSYVGLCVF